MINTSESEIYSDEEEDDYDSESEMQTTGALDSRHSIVKFSELKQGYHSLNLFIQMEFCSGLNL